MKIPNYAIGPPRSILGIYISYYSKSAWFQDLKQNHTFKYFLHNHSLATFHSTIVYCLMFLVHKFINVHSFNTLLYFLLMYFRSLI